MPETVQALQRRRSLRSWAFASGAAGHTWLVEEILRRKDSPGYNSRMAHRRSPATAADPALLQRVEGIVRRVLGHTPADVYLFGSWARGAQRPTSDIDVAIASAAPLPRALLASLREALEESTIPNRVDVVDLAETDAAFRDRVHREGILWIASGSA